MDPEIAQMVKQRREALHGVDDGHQPWGLALSGGGIRSATFCLGLLKALAGQGLLLRFDLLSTVSGGGYVGAVLGRLCTQAGSAQGVRAVEAAFADADRVRFGVWLRANGRYLIPGGLRDILFAVALYLRNLLGTHIELAIAALLIGVPLAMFNLLAWEAAALTVEVGTGPPAGAAQAAMAFVARWPTLWLLLVLPWVLSILLAQAYWSVRDRPRWAVWLGQLAMWCAVLAIVLALRPWIDAQKHAPDWAVLAAAAFAGGWILALLAMAVFNRDPQGAGALRNRLTDWLSMAFMATLVIVLLGLLDWVAWWFAAHTRDTRIHWGGWLLAGAAALRGMLPLLFSGKREAPGLGKKLLMTLASLIGLLAAFSLAAWWIGVFYATVLLPVFVPEQGLDFGRGWIWLAIVGGGAVGYAVLTGRNFAFLNLSSLHMFYKARIVRGYLGAANAQRVGGDVFGHQASLSPPAVPIGAVDARDDIGQHDYAPQRHGGPVHLINVCINQTHDPRQRLFNRDRKSLPLTVGPEGWMQAAGAPWAQARGDGALTLGAWAAISGAAFAPGLGRLTRRGLAALSLFAGLRLGYWWDSRLAGVAQQGARRLRPNPLSKTWFLLLECFGSFPGSDSRQWYLSDGGHFENTGAYALLRQEAALIVIADCGADPDYRFCDLENLTRRARIDLNAHIDFLRPRADAGADIVGAFGSLNDLASANSQACLALAEVRYASGRSGRLLLVKPNVSAALPVDLVNFKADNPLFPQQPTTDQFFDEAQWESYYRLGSEIGKQLRADVVTRLAGGTGQLFEPDDGQGPPPAPRPGAAAGAEAGPAAQAAGVGLGLAGAAVAASRLQARVLKAGAVTATVGLGTAATLGIAAWQGVDAWRSATQEKQASEALAFKDLTERWSRLRTGATSSDAAGSLAAELLRTGDLLCKGDQDNFLARFSLSVRIVDDAKEACQRELELSQRPLPVGFAAGATTPSRTASLACRRLISEDNGIDCLQDRRAAMCPPRYWGRDYSGAARPRNNCSQAAVGLGTVWGALHARLSAPFAVRFRDVDADVLVAGAPVDPAASAAAPPYVPGHAPMAPMPAPPPSAGTGVPPSAVPQAGEAPASVALPAPVPVPRTDARACRDKTVYVQVYGAGQRTTGEWARKVSSDAGAQAPAIEDVLATARHAGRAPPRGFAQPTIVAHPGTAECAALLRQRLEARPVAPELAGWQVRPLPARLTPAPRTLEIWLPRE